jgi:2-deoxy-D-gluconate 3-dehydrogenase
MNINELFSVEGKVAVVTGSSKGIGKMIATGLAMNGAKVYITARHGSTLQKTQAELLEKYNADVYVISCDLSTQDGIDTLYNEVCAREDSIDILVNNAGVAGGEDFDLFSESSWDKVMDLNVKSMFFLTQKFKKLLKTNATSNDPSRVVNIGSVAGIVNPGIDTYAYSTSKAAVHHLTRSLAGRLVKENILVNAIAPGPYPSDLLGPAIGFNYSMVEEANPRGRIGTLEDISGLVIFLCSRAGAFTVGETITSDGGVTKTTGHWK